jgi:N-ethylmaleimide reductase
MSTKPIEALLTPYTLGDLQLKNRIVMAPLTRTRAENQGKVPNELMAEYYAQRAGAGLIITEGTFVSEQGQGWYGAERLGVEGFVASQNMWSLAKARGIPV